MTNMFNNVAYHISTILNQMTSVYSTIVVILNIAMVFFVARFISKYAESFFPRLFWMSFGLILLSSIFTSPCDCHVMDAIFGAGFVAPHISYFKDYFEELFFRTKRFGINTYYLFITIWYKIIRFYNWIISLYKKIASFISRFNKKHTNTNYEQEYEEYTKQHYSHHKSYNENTNSSSSSNSSSNSSSSSSSNNYQDTNSSYEDTSSNQTNDNTDDDYYDEDNLEAQLKDDPEFAQFFSSSNYIVLGVDENMSFNEIKKVYRKLLREYHPDLNPDIEEIATIITQKINSAYGSLKDIYKS